MPSDPLLPDPSDVEQALAGRRCPEPSAGLRDRILTAVSAQRDAPRRPHPRKRWQHIWQAAAVIVVAANLWMTAANTVRFGRLEPRAGVEARRVRPAAEHDIPDTFDGNDPLNQLVASVLANLTPAPQAGTLGRRFFSNEEEREWALP
jgi:hypothetical protein